MLLANQECDITPTDLLKLSVPGELCVASTCQCSRMFEDMRSCN